MRVVDLTHVIKEGMPVYPGTEPPKLRAANTHERDGFRETEICLYSHTGTHVDAPAHIVKGAVTLDMIDVSGFVGRAAVIDCRDIPEGGLIGADRLSVLEGESSGLDFVLFCTGYDKRWGTDGYYRGFPVLSDEALALIIGTDLKGIGSDTISLDPVEDVNLSRHNRLFRAKSIINIENLKGLDELIGESFTLACLPMHFEDSDGAPARAVAIVD